MFNHYTEENYFRGKRNAFMNVVAKSIKLTFNNEVFYLNIGNGGGSVIEEKQTDMVYSVNEGDENEDSYYFLYVTDDCNMCCDYCFNEIGRGNKKKNHRPVYSYEELINFFSNNSQNSNIGIRFFGGEPILALDWIEGLIERLRSLEFKVRYDIFTNATLADSKFVELVKKENIRVYVSVNGGQEAYKGGKFRKEILDKINSLSDEGIGITGRLVWKPNREETLVSLIKEPMDRGLKVVSVTLPWGITEGEFDDTLFLHQLEELVAFYIKQVVNRNYTYIGIAPFVNYMTKWLSKEDYEKVFCGAGKSVVSISTTGECYPCECYSNAGNYLSGDIYMGIKELFSDLDADSIVPCKDCDIRYFCKAKCFGDAYYTNGVPSEMNKLKCKTERAFIAASAYILKELEKYKEEYQVFKFLILKGEREYANSK